MLSTQYVFVKYITWGVCVWCINELEWSTIQVCLELIWDFHTKTCKIQAHWYEQVSLDCEYITRGWEI